MHVLQYLTFTMMPLMSMSLVGGGAGRVAPMPGWLPVVHGDKGPPSSSGSGGCGLRGTMPGSPDDVRMSSVITYLQLC